MKKAIRKDLADNTGRIYKCLYMSNFLLKELFEEILPYEKGYEKGWHFLSVRKEGIYKYYIVKPKEELRKLIDRMTLDNRDSISLELIQQQATIGKKPPYTFKYLPQYLLIAQHTAILSNSWINFYPKKEVEKVFGEIESGEI